jgi:hypothetical protein
MSGSVAGGVLCAAVCGLLICGSGAGASAQGAKSGINPDAQTLADYQGRPKDRGSSNQWAVCLPARASRVNSTTSLSR